MAGVIDIRTDELVKRNGCTRKKARAARIILRDGRRCVVCGRSEVLTVHHIRPKVIGGTGHDDNLVTVCNVCHQGFHRVSSWIAQQVAGWLIWPLGIVLVWLGRTRRAR